MVLLLSAFKWWNLRIIEKEDKIKKLRFTKEFFNGLKAYAPARFYSVFWILRRILFVGIITLMEGRGKYEVLLGIITIQGIYLGYLCITRPFQMMKDNL